jgi:hypothetical protein
MEEDKIVFGRLVPIDNPEEFTISADSISGINIEQYDSLNTMSGMTITGHTHSQYSYNASSVSTVSSSPVISPLSTIQIGAMGAIQGVNLDEFTNVTLKVHKELIARVEQLEKYMKEEEELRSRHPTLKMAYDEYRLLLTLAKQHSNPMIDEPQS